MGIERKWVLKTPADPGKVQKLAEEFNMECGKVLAELLVQRGIETLAQFQEFINPSLSNLHDPFLMKDMDKAVERLHQAIIRNEKILIYGDYDVDGTTAVALVYSFVKKFTSNVDFYVPDRYDEGYGVSQKGLDWAYENGFQLIITLDCGIKAIEKTKYAAEKGMDMIICDHHLPEESIPDAVAVLDPKREDCTYPFDDLCGCGVGFKLVQGYSQKYGIEFASLEPLLDLLVVSIASDLVSMTGENRILAYYGLKRLNSSPREGLKSMISISNLEPGHITIDDIIFKIGPKINAAGRIDTGRLAVDLLIEDNSFKAEKIAVEINDNNNERKKIDREITQEALEMVNNGTALSLENVTIVYNPSWNKGVVGIVASRLVEAFYKPTVVLTKSNNFITGSARSIHGFDLYEAIESCADLLENFGGHVYAAGLTLKEENLKEFCERMDKFVAEKLDVEQSVPITEIDLKIDFPVITGQRFPYILRKFQPFGPGNSNPVFMTEDVFDIGGGRRVGANRDHLKLDLVQGDKTSYPIPAIGFNMSEFYDHLRNGNPVDVCYSIFENYYRGRSSTQLRLKDIRKHKD